MTARTVCGEILDDLEDSFHLICILDDGHDGFHEAVIRW